MTFRQAEEWALHFKLEQQDRDLQRAIEDMARDNERAQRTFNA